MRTISVQNMPGGFEVEKPTFLDWMKAGMAFTIGAGIVTIAAAITWFFVSMSLMGAMFRVMAR